jgi:GTP-binding protein EngB required for normal cell division
VRSVLDALDLAIARGEAVLDEDTTRSMTILASRLRTRAGFIGDVLVVALAGGTGSGKSSLLNAIVGEELVETGVVRPTTSDVLAVFRDDPYVDLGPLWTALGIERHVAHDGAASLVLVDLPDFDSTVEAHRHIVSEVLPVVDVVVWVLDPEKYADPVLHEGFLSSMTRYEEQFLFVLNQVDRLGDEFESAISSLHGHLTDDGFTAPRVVGSIAADVETSDIADLVGALADRWDTKSAAIAKLALDTRSAANDGWRACGSIDTREMGDRSRDEVALARATFVWLGVEAFALYHHVAGR